MEKLKAVILPVVCDEMRGDLLKAGASFDFLKVVDEMSVLVTKCSRKRLQKIIRKYGIDSYYRLYKNNKLELVCQNEYTLVVSNKLEKSLNKPNTMTYLSINDSGRTFYYF